MSARLITARELAGRLGVSSETVLRWARRGDIPAIKLPGGGIRFDENEVERWLEERATPSQGASNHPGGTPPRR